MKAKRRLLLSVEEFPPAPGQGAICVETRIGDAYIKNLVLPLNDNDTLAALTLERAYLKALDGFVSHTDCRYIATVDQDIIRFSGQWY